MAINTRQLFLLAYDIADPRRLQQVHRMVRSAGIAVQYSVFLIPGTPREIDALLSQLDDVIHPTHDDVRVYPLPKRLEVARFGRQHFPAGIDLVHDHELQQALLNLIGDPNG